jgi:hypothetical protein
MGLPQVIDDQPSAAKRDDEAREPLQRPDRHCDLLRCYRVLDSSCNAGSLPSRVPDHMDYVPRTRNRIPSSFALVRTSRPTEAAERLGPAHSAGVVQSADATSIPLTYRPIPCPPHELHHIEAMGQRRFRHSERALANRLAVRGSRFNSGGSVMAGRAPDVASRTRRSRGVEPSR